MQLTPENKNHIDSMSYESLLSHWRFAPVGDPWFRGETGDYWSKRMKELRENGADHVGASKRLGWSDSGQLSSTFALPLAVAAIAMYLLHFMAAHGVFQALSVIGGAR